MSKPKEKRFRFPVRVIFETEAEWDHATREEAIEEFLSCVRDGLIDESILDLDRSRMRIEATADENNDTKGGARNV